MRVDCRTLCASPPANPHQHTCRLGALAPRNKHRLRCDMRVVWEHMRKCTQPAVTDTAPVGLSDHALCCSQPAALPPEEVSTQQQSATPPAAAAASPQHSLSASLANASGGVVGGVVAGPLVAAAPVRLVLGLFGQPA